MEWWYHIPTAFYLIFVFLFGLMVGSFINVLIARLPYDKSIVWPSSRCMSCLRPIRLADNLPIIGYLRLRGKCRFCGATFSSRYLWVELGTGLAFVALYVVEVLTSTSMFDAQWHYMPGLKFGSTSFNIPPLKVWVFFAHHACLLTILIAAAAIDAGHRIIPPILTYTGTLIGIAASTFLPWPWPNGLETVPDLARYAFPTQAANWGDIRLMGQIPTGVMPIPFAGPPPDWCPPGSTLLGFLSGVIGAVAGVLVGRGIKWGFEVGFGQEALGLGDADLLMCVGSFLGWQIAMLALPVGAFVALSVIMPVLLWRLIRGRPVRTDLPFGPGIAAGAIFTWIFWPWIGELVRFPAFDWMATGVVVVIVGVGLLAAGMILKRRPKVSGMTPEIAIIDYGMANLRSVQKAFEAVGHSAEITADPNRIAEFPKVVLPGVGAFRDAIVRFRGTDLGSVVKSHIDSGKPFLGICLGLQMLFTRGHEDGTHPGLDLYPGDVVRFPVVPGLKVPHMGWNTLRFTRQGCPLFRDLPADPAVYFTHSYYAKPTDRSFIVAEADYPTPFCTAVWRDNVMATQFHPEKSQRVGLQMLKNFAAM